MPKKYVYALIASGVLAASCAPSDGLGIAEIEASGISTNDSADCADHTGTQTNSSRDVQRNTTYTGTISVSANGAACMIQSSAIPNHDVNDGPTSFRNEMSPQNLTFSIPRNPQQAASPTSLTHRSYDAVMINGVPVDVLSAGCYDPSARRTDANGNTPAGCSDTHPWLIDPPSAGNFFGEDSQNGHSQPDGTYHYHANPMALLGDDDRITGSSVIGFAADGFPIFGTYFKDSTGTVRKAISGYSLKQGARPSGAGNPSGNHTGYYVADWEFTGQGDLDECNGMTVDGQYGYYATDSYPWLVKCLKGTPDSSFNKRRP
ncbi:MAG: YHYH protein [Pseudomonadota bacterium]